jgi:hypothetical protein
MALTFTTKKYTSEEKTHEVVAHDEWGMFTTAGNKRLQTLAQRLIDDVQTTDNFMARLKMFEKFIMAWRRMDRYKSYSEASDTDVRERVWSHCTYVARALGINIDTIDDLWEHTY